MFVTQQWSDGDRWSWSSAVSNLFYLVSFQVSKRPSLKLKMQGALEHVDI